MKKAQYILYTILVLSSIQSLVAQSGINVYAGLSSASNKSELITPDGMAHNGYHLGADARLNDGKMYFLVGGQYHTVDYISSAESAYLSFDSKMSWLKLRVGLGFNIIEFTDHIAVTAKALGGINVISTYPSVLAGAPYDNYNTGTAGASLGLGIDCYNITVSAEYEKGFFNAVNMVSGTEFDFLTLSVGFLF